MIAAQTHAPVNHARLRTPISNSMMPRPLVMLAQQIAAVIVGVGRAHDDVNMIFVMLFVLGKGLAGLMIELDQQHRAMDAVIEDAVFFHAADPGKTSVFEVRMGFGQFDRRVTGPEFADVNLNQLRQQIMLGAV